MTCVWTLSPFCEGTQSLGTPVRQIYPMHTLSAVHSCILNAAEPVTYLGIKSTLAQRGGRRAPRGVQATARRSRPVRIRMRSVQELEALVNERFKVELEEVQDERDRLYERVSQCLELKNNMTMLQDQKRSSLKTMVDLGCNFYVQARMCAQPSRAAPCALDRPA